MRGHRLVPFLIAAVMLATSLVAGGSASAKEVLRFSDVYDDTFAFDGCGFLIEGTVSGRYHEIAWAEPGAGVDVNGEAIITGIDHHNVGGGTYTNPANGKVLTFSYSDHFREDVISYNGAVDVELDDGSIVPGSSYTLAWRERGVPVKIKKPKGGVVSIDAGLITDWVATIVIYYVDGERFVDVPAENDPTVNGPHPLFRTDRFCEIMNQYLA